MILLPVILIFHLLQTANTTISENLIHPVDPRIAQLLATHDDGSKQDHPRQFSLTPVQKYTQAPSEIEYKRTFASVFVRQKANSEQTKNRTQLCNNSKESRILC